MKILLINLFLLSLITAGFYNSKDSTYKGIEEVSNDFHSIQEGTSKKNSSTKEINETSKQVLEVEIKETSGKESKQDTKKQSSNTNKKQNLSKEEALKIVLADAGILQNDIANLKIEYDDYIYDIEFITDNYKYDYEVYNSKIISKEKDKIVETVAKQNTDIISKDTAINIALNHVNLDTNMISNLEIELDKNKYEIEFDYNYFEYSFEINASNGEILEFEKDN